MQLRLSEEASRDYPDEGKRGQAFGEFPQEIGVVNMGGGGTGALGRLRGVKADLKSFLECCLDEGWGDMGISPSFE
jgi:hypothetical protein